MDYNLDPNARPEGKRWKRKLERHLNKKLSDADVNWALIYVESLSETWYPNGVKELKVILQINNSSFIHLGDVVKNRSEELIDELLEYNNIDIDNLCVHS
jgi:hypothetical protein